MLVTLGLSALVVASAALVVRFLPAANRWLLGIAALSPYLMLGAPMAVVLFALSRQWTLAWVAAVPALAVLAIRLRLCIAARAPEGVPLRFVSANLLLGRADPAAVAALAHQRADVLAVQELTPELAETLSAALADAFPHRVLRPRDRAAGVGLWSRHPIIASGVDETFSRGLVWARLRLPHAGAESTVICTHMPPPRSAFGSWRAEIARLRPALQQLPAPGSVVVCGDFNATLDVYEYRRLLRGGYRDGAAQAGAGMTRTHPSHLPIPPLLAVDRILTRQSTATSITPVALAGSDHLALLATVVLG
ncbi:endonuclease/exonuclease/phosphatase family protein [Mycobacterium sp. NPDC003323]